MAEGRTRDSIVAGGRGLWCAAGRRKPAQRKRNRCDVVNGGFVRARIPGARVMGCFCLRILVRAATGRGLQCACTCCRRVTGLAGERGRGKSTCATSGSRLNIRRPWAIIIMAARRSNASVCSITTATARLRTLIPGRTLTRRQTRTHHRRARFPSMRHRRRCQRFEGPAVGSVC